MHRGFTTVDYEATLAQQVRLDECLPADHLARFIAKVLGPLDFAAIAARYGARGGRAYAPERLFGRLVYGSAIGVFSARKIARATYESAPFRLLAGTLHPDHDTIATFRCAFLASSRGGSCGCCCWRRKQALDERTCDQGHVYIARAVERLLWRWYGTGRPIASDARAW
ncbi:MAG TPA: transposase [Thermomicrobiales bacterium]|jgi:transposase|nr:transposase [Thermomicrobiales bacterium]